MHIETLKELKASITQGEWHGKDGQIYPLETGKTIAHIYTSDTQKADTEFIVLAVNNFVSLVETLETIKENYEMNLRNQNDVSLQEIRAGISIINTTLNKIQ